MKNPNRSENFPNVPRKAERTTKRAYPRSAAALLCLALCASCTSAKKTGEPSAEAPTSVAASAPSAEAASASAGTSNSSSARTKGPGTGQDSSPWATKMISLSDTLSDLLPLVVSKNKFNAPAEQARIESDTRRLQQLTHSLAGSSKPNADPAMKIMSNLFAEDIERALDSLRAGNRDYARQILRDTTSYCIQCHTQTNNGPQFPRLNLAIDPTELTKVEQAEFFAATRQFDRAIAAYRSALDDRQLAKSDPFAWEQAARSALAIIVKVKNDPKEATLVVERIKAQSALPESTKKSLVDWKKSIQEWMTEQKSATKLRLDPVKQAEAMITKARARQEFPLDHSQDILYFRAASLLHDYLQSNSGDSPTSGKALYLAGIAAEATRDMNFWTLHESYYEQCIRAQPHTQLAEKCFANLKDSITLGYSGSSGVNIPPEINRRLEGFRKAAAPAKSESSTQ